MGRTKQTARLWDDKDPLLYSSGITKETNNYKCPKCERYFKTEMTLKPLKKEPELKCCAKCRQKEARKIMKERYQNKKN